MNAFWNLLPSGGWERLLADAAWQSSAIAACALIAAWLVRRRPALRAAILFSAAALSLAAPLLSSVVRLSGGGLLSPPIRGGSYSLIVPRELHRADGSAANVTIALPAQPDNSVFAETSPITAGWRFRPWPWIVGLWLAASGCLAFRLLRGVLAVRRWIKMARPCHDAKIEAALSRAAQAIGVRPPELLWSAGFNSPALVMLGPARLLLPTEMPADVDWFAVFCHELAHRARRDDLNRLVVELAVIALPWQPLLWLVRRRFRAACEEACDDWAVDAGADPVEFASLLVALVPERRPAFALGMAESPSATRHRILRLLAMQGTVHPRLGTWVGAAGWVAAIALAITLALLQFNSRPRLSDPIPLATSSERQSGDGTVISSPANWTRSATPPPWGNTPLAEAIATAAADSGQTNVIRGPYVIEPPDILTIDAVKIVPKSPYHIESLDTLKLVVANPLIDQPLSGEFTIDIDGELQLGPQYGSLKVAGLTLGEARVALEKHLANILREPALSLTLGKVSGEAPIAGEHPVGPDGTVNLGRYGAVYVRGMTIRDATKIVQNHLEQYLDKPRVAIDVFAYNSKVYYVIYEGVGSGDTLVRVPITGNETVLDALAQRSDGKIPDPANCWVWVARPKAGKQSSDQILPVDWQAVLFGRDTSSNWQIQPGDRIFVRPRNQTN